MDLVFPHYSIKPTKPGGIVSYCHGALEPNPKVIITLLALLLSDKNIYKGNAHGAMVIILVNRHGNLSSNPR